MPDFDHTPRELVECEGVGSSSSLHELSKEESRNEQLNRISNSMYRISSKVCFSPTSIKSENNANVMTLKAALKASSPVVLMKPRLAKMPISTQVNEALPSSSSSSSSSSLPSNDDLSGTENSGSRHNKEFSDRGSQSSRETGSDSDALDFDSIFEFACDDDILSENADFNADEKSEHQDEESPEELQQKLIVDITNILANRLRNVMAKRQNFKKISGHFESGIAHQEEVNEQTAEHNDPTASCAGEGTQESMTRTAHSGKIQHGLALHEYISQSIHLPYFKECDAVSYFIDPNTIELGPQALAQLKNYVTMIASLYRNNPFHNFEHAANVTENVDKLLQRVLTQEGESLDTLAALHDDNVTAEQRELARKLHDATFGLTSDPLAQFAIVFAALIHDVDHFGVSNMQLVKEGVPIAIKYKNKSVAEQNSVDLAWDILFSDPNPDDEKLNFTALQRCIFTTSEELLQFRQVVVSVVMATDIFDQELSAFRKSRWETVFSDVEPNEEGKKEVGGEDSHAQQHRKATLVIEHIMQASDVSHAMQDWEIYQKWNQRLFDELYCAWKAGRMGCDPSTFWYEGEIKFLDGYIIPLAEKLQKIGVFGSASEECLHHAKENRAKWELQGASIVKDLLSGYAERQLKRGHTSPGVAPVATNALPSVTDGSLDNSSSHNNSCHGRGQSLDKSSHSNCNSSRVMRTRQLAAIRRSARSGAHKPGQIIY